MCVCVCVIARNLNSQKVHNSALGEMSQHKSVHKLNSLEAQVLLLSIRIFSHTKKCHTTLMLEFQDSGISTSI